MSFSAQPWSGRNDLGRPVTEAQAPLPGPGRGVGPLDPNGDRLARLLAAEQGRREAAELADRRLAVHRLTEVTSVLDEILVAARAELLAACSTPVRPEVAGRAAGLATLARLPLEQLAEMLGLPAEASVSIVLDRLAAGESVSALERDVALAEIDTLRQRLREVRPEEPALLQRIIRRVVAVAVALAAAAAGAALAAAVVGEDLVVEIVKAGVMVLVGMTLAVGERRLLEYRRRIDPVRLAEHRRERLVTALDDVAAADTAPAFRHERAVALLSMVIGTYACRDAEAGLVRPDTAELHHLLDTIDAVSADVVAGRVHADELRRLRRRLDALGSTSPARPRGPGGRGAGGHDGHRGPPGSPGRPVRG